MKLIEKLALDIAREEGCSECAYRGALSAFRIMRDMIVERLSDPMEDGQGWAYYFRSFGEEEVKPSPSEPS